MSTQDRIPIRVPFITGESFVGYLGRVAERNVLSSTTVLCETLKIDGKGYVSRLLKSRANIVILSSFLQLSAADLDNIIPSIDVDDPKTLIVHGLELREQNFVRSTRRVSPTSLTASPHSRFSWELADLSFCRESWEVLVDTCPAPSCGRQLTALPRKGVHTCDSCGFDLRKATTETIAREDRGILQFVADLVSLDALEVQRGLLQVHPMFRHLNRGVLLQLISLFGRAAKAKLKPTEEAAFPQSNYPHSTISGAKILRGFPASIFEFDEQDAGVKSLELFARLKEFIKTGHAETTAKVVLDMIKEIKPIASYSAQSLAIVRKDNVRITLRETANLLGVDNAAVRRIVESGALKPQHIRGKRRQIDWFDRKDVEALGAMLKDRISTDAIHSEFGLSFTAIEQLVELEQLQWHPSAAIAKCFSGKFLVDSAFRSFLRDLDLEIDLQTAADIDRITLSECFALAGPSPKPWGPLLAATLAGTLAGGLKQISSKNGFKASNLTVDPQVAVQILTRSFAWQPPAEPSREECSQFEAEERLACNPNDIAALIKSGDLKRVKRQATRLEHQSVLEASMTFISTREIAARMGLEVRQIGPWARKWLLKKPEGISMWRRADIEPFLPNGGHAHDMPPREAPLQLTLFAATR